MRWLMVSVLGLCLLTAVLLAIYTVIRPRPYLPDRDLTAEFHALMRHGAGIEREEENRWALFDRMMTAMNQAEQEAMRKHDTHAPRIVYASLVDDDASLVNFRPVAEIAMNELERAGVFDMLADLSRDPRAVPPVSTATPTIDSMIPHLGSLRDLARAVDVRQQRAKRAGDVAGAIDAMESKAALARIAFGMPTLLSFLTGVAIDVWAQESAMNIATMREATLADIHRLMTIIKPPPDIAHAVEGERLWVLQQVMATPPSPVPLLGANPSRDAANVETFYDVFVAYVRGEPTPQLRKGETPDEWADRSFSRFSMVSMIGPGVSNFVDADRQARTRYAGAIIGLALEAHHAQHGRYPSTLAELTPDILPKFPTSPYDPKGLVYRLPTAENTLGGRAYLLYSIGADGIDNGGLIHPEGGHLGLVKDKGIGYDFVIGR